MGDSKYIGRDLEAMHFASNYHKWILEEFRPYLGTCIAEVGAGAGSFSALLLDRQIDQLTAFEPSQDMHEILKDRISHLPNVELINNIFSTKERSNEILFDSVIYVNVLEHIEHDKEELIQAFNALKPNGYILIFVPALSWLYSDLDKTVGHFRRYHKGDLINLVETAGFDIVKAKYFDFIGVAPWYLFFVLLRKELNPANVGTYDKLVIPIMKKLESIIPPPIGKNLILVGKKAAP